MGMNKFVYNTLYKTKLDKKFFFRKCIGLSLRIVHFFDGRKDKRVCGCSLVKYVPSLYRESMGATGSESTCYWALDQILKNVEFTREDNFIDVGCGKGRVLAYLVRKNVPCHLTGIELNKDVAEYARSWTQRYDNVTLMNGNAFELDYNQYSIMFMARPFETETFHSFIQQFEEKQHRPVKLIYWCDTQSGSFLEGRPGWTMLERAWVLTGHGLIMYRWPQRYSIWTYDPDSRAGDNEAE